MIELDVTKEEIKPRKYSTVEEAVADASEQWVRNVDTLVARAIMQYNIVDLTRIVIVQKQTVEGYNTSIWIKE